MTFRGEMGRRFNLSQAARTKISIVNVSTNSLVRWKHYQAAMIIRTIRIINIIFRPGYALSASNKVGLRWVGAPAAEVCGRYLRQWPRIRVIADLSSGTL